MFEEASKLPFDIYPHQPRKYWVRNFLSYLIEQLKMVKPQLFWLVQDWEVKAGLVRLQLINSSVNGYELAHIFY